MGWKDAVFSGAAQQIITDTGVGGRSFKIPEGMVISSLAIRLSGTGGASTPAVDTDPTMITRVRVKRSGTVIVDATGTQLRAIARQRQGRIPTVVNATGAYTAVVVPIIFGRVIKDPYYMLVADSNTYLEIDYGTLIASTAWATGTMTITITAVTWVGTVPAGFSGAIGAVEVEDKATGTGRGVFDLIKGKKLAALLIEVVTLTSVKEVVIQAKGGDPVVYSTIWRDILDTQNWARNKDTAETTLGFISFSSEEPDAPVTLPDLSILSEPILYLERGATTTVTCVVQLSVY